MAGMAFVVVGGVHGYKVACGIGVCIEGKFFEVKTYKPGGHKKVGNMPRIP